MLLPMTHLSPLEILLNTLINRFLLSSYCITILSDITPTFTSPLAFTYIMPGENLVEQILNLSEMGCSDYIVHIKEPKKFMSAFEKVIHLGNIRRSDRKIIILPFDENTNNTIWVPEVLALKESGFVANLLIIMNCGTKEDCVLFDLVTHKFVGADEQVHEPLKLERWNSCTAMFGNEANLFPHDMTNMYGKTLKVAGFTYKPYVLLDVDTALVPLGRDGIEIRIVDELCRWINCTVKVIPEDIDQWGEIYENETSGIGVIGSVLEDRADVGITALYSWYEEWRVLDFSAAIVRTAITCVAPAPRLLSSWEMPLMPFTWYSWLAVIITFFYSSIGLLIAEEFSANSHPFLTVFGMMIAQSQFEAGVSWKIRSVTGWLLIVGLILGCAYGAGLASTFTVPRYEPSIDTVQDIVDRRMPWGATHDAWTFSLTLSTEPLVIQLVSQFDKHPFDELKRKSFARSMAFSIEKLPAGNYAIGEYLTKEAMLDMMIMLEDFYYEQCVVMLRKSSPYTEKLSALVGRLHQSGLMLAWETQVALKHLNYKVQQEVRLSRSKNDGGVTKPLSISNVVGVFIMYVTGVIVSAAVFLSEIIVHYHKTTRNVSSSSVLFS